MPMSTYKRSVRSRNAAALLLAVMLGLAGYKAYFSWQKTKLYDEASALQAAGNELEAANAYTRAQGIRVFDYKERETTEALAVLLPATELDRFFAELNMRLLSAEQQSDTALLTASYKDYQAKAREVAAQDETAQKRFAEMAAAYKTEETFAQAFGSAKQKLVKDLENDISKKSFDSDSQIALLLQLPPEVFNGEKTKKQELNKLLERYDQARLDAGFKAGVLADVLNEAVRIRKFYDANGVEAAWLQPKVETYTQGTLAKLIEKNDLRGFIASAIAYQSAKELGGASSKVNAYIQTTIRKQLDRAEQLVSAGKFADAIALYTALGGYKDTAKEVAETEQRWLQSDPQQLLRKATGSELAFANTIGAKAKWGAQFAAAGIADNKTLVVARLMPDQQIMTVRTALDKGLSVKSLQWGDKLLGVKADVPILLLESASKTRKARYIAYEAAQPEMRKILDVEADNMDYDRSGMLVFDNPAGGTAEAGSGTGARAGGGTVPETGTGKKTYYEYRDGGYALAKTSADIVEIPLAELTRHKNEQVRFSCTITSVEAGKATVRLSNGYITLSGNFRFKPGPAVVTGTYEGIEAVKKAADPLYEYKVNVSDLSQ